MNTLLLNQLEINEVVKPNTTTRGRYCTGRIGLLRLYPGGLTGFSRVPNLSHSSVPSVSSTGSSSFPLSLPLALPPRARAFPAAQARRGLGGIGSHRFACGHHSNLSLQECLQLAHLALCVRDLKPRMEDWKVNTSMRCHNTSPAKFKFDAVSRTLSKIKTRFETLKSETGSADHDRDQTRTENVYVCLIAGRSL